MNTTPKLYLTAGVVALGVTAFPYVKELLTNPLGFKAAVQTALNKGDCTLSSVKTIDTTTVVGQRKKLEPRIETVFSDGAKVFSLWVSATDTKTGKPTLTHMTVKPGACDVFERAENGPGRGKIVQQASAAWQPGQ